MRVKKIIVLGIRGIPAKHGGFETFAEYLCKYLQEKKWEVTVYCQEEGKGGIYESEWEGIKLIHIPVSGSGPKSTIIFDFKSVINSLKHDGVFLTLGYNTAIFNVLHRLKRKSNVINMDGIEWRRHKWGAVAKTWFWLNERFGCWFGNHLVADHPKIADHLATRVSKSKITTIAYGAPEVSCANEEVLSEFGLSKNNYAILIARAEPENSILEVVKAFSSQKRNSKLVILGDYQVGSNGYHRDVYNAASEEVIFLGAIYDAEIVSSLRYFSRIYVHGHQVGGTNPSLVEALGAGNAVLAKDNEFNRWVAKDGAIYFKDVDSLTKSFSEMLENDELVNEMRQNSRVNFSENFRWEYILHKYEDLLTKFLPN